MSTKVEMITSKGTMTVELDEEASPVTAKNFLSYVDKEFFDGLIFHRVIPGFMVQCGGMDPDMKEKPNDAPIPIESDNGLKNERGTLAMARTNDPNSATSQFFVNLVDSPFLDYTDPANPGYTVFGKVTDGIETIDEIAKVKTGRKGTHDDVPTEQVTIESVRRV
ncbi:MAG: peptidyl-prolyl cis-trans isomerase [Planctomycetes bacterium]|nr:peptidyl-prolyl cis-trans isomerase [Planctomycetota bacterium]